jgi:hypothetical protein
MMNKNLKDIRALSFNVSVFKNNRNRVYELETFHSDQASVLSQTDQINKH